MKPRLPCSTKTCRPVNGANPPGGGGRKSRSLPERKAAAFVVRNQRFQPGRRPRRMISTITRYPTVAARAATVWRVKPEIAVPAPVRRATSTRPRPPREIKRTTTWLVVWAVVPRVAAISQEPARPAAMATAPATTSTTIPAPSLATRTRSRRGSQVNSDAIVPEAHSAPMKLAELWASRSLSRR